MFLLKTQVTGAGGRRVCVGGVGGRGVGSGGGEEGFGGGHFSMEEGRYEEDCDGDDEDGSNMPREQDCDPFGGER